ncbi:hypothetical protein F7725_024508 [Dissostichus mawsoni]|uniref:Uncharacterized protein n=1 Tax=Dissostichus mawsoni TaxID=36200 RepID=A0A7J5Y1K6_DISMA|nr:hypothetical protein F7725_024508 [Dissostichus mawsoni]
MHPPVKGVSCSTSLSALLPPLPPSGSPSWTSWTNTCTQDPLEAIPESLKNMLLVMDTAGIFHSADSRTGYSDLWEITWERIDCFLPLLREELFKQTVIADPGPSPPAESVQPTPSAGQPSSPRVSQPPSPVPVSPAETRTPSRPASPLEPPAASANGSDRSSPPPASTPPMPVGVPPMSLPIILNPALIEASSPVPLLPPPRPDEVKSMQDQSETRENTRVVVPFSEVLSCWLCLVFADMSLTGRGTILH